jgi:hypothetical protein
MIFRYTWPKVITGRKTQTRRLVGDSEELKSDVFGGIPTVVRITAGCDINDPQVGLYEWWTGEIKWQVGRTYLVQPAPNKPAVWWHYNHPEYAYETVSETMKPVALYHCGYVPARIRITGIRREQLQDITLEDAFAEGYSADVLGGSSIDVFAWHWNHTHMKPGTRWEDNPEVWVLTFELTRIYP